jgi:anti-sigma factor RsiW
MTAHAHDPELTPREAADLSALADGSLEPARRDQVQAWIDASPERTVLYERERRVVELLHAARSTERAPERLRARVAAGAARPVARRRISWVGGGLATAAAALALALVLVIGAGTHAPSLAQATAVASHGALQPAPAPARGGRPGMLGQDVEDVYFPDWSTAGWHATGQRTDVVDGRQMVTVYYAWRGEQIAYTIVGSPALGQPAAPVNHVGGLALRTLNLDGRLVVTWRRANHTCILSTGAGVSPALLRGLAAWHPVE